MLGAILDQKTAQRHDKPKKRTKNDPKTLLPAACGVPRGAPGSFGGPKNEPFLAPSKTSVVDVPTCDKNASKKAHETRSMLPPARNRVFGFRAQDLALMDLSFSGFGPPKSSELRPSNLSFEGSIDVTSEELGGPKFSELRSLESPKLRLMCLSSEDLGPPNSLDLRLMDMNCEDLGGPKTLG